MFKIRFALVELTLLLLLIVLSTSVYTFVAWQKHYHFQTFGWDTSVFLQELYFTSHFKTPFSSMVKINGLGDHFQVLFLILGTPLFIVWQDPKALFFLQAFVASLSIIPLYLLLKNQLQQFKLQKVYLLILGLAVCLSYLFSVSFQGMMTDEFHNEPLLTLPLLFLIYFLFKKVDFGYWIAYLCLLLTKEIFPIFGLPIGVYVYLKTRDLKKALFTSILGLLTFYFLLFQLMPYLSATNGYLHFAAGNRPSDIFLKFFDNPLLLLTDFFNHPEKLKTIFISLFSFGFLPLLSPTDLLLPISALALRFFDDTTPRLWEFNNHYAAPLIPLLAVTTVLAVKKILVIISKRKKINLSYVVLTLSLYLVFCTLVSDVLFHGSLNSLFKKTILWSCNLGERRPQSNRDCPKRCNYCFSKFTTTPSFSKR